MNDTAWDRGFPVKYLLVDEDDDGEPELWGRCAGVEGLFADPVPPPREVLTLRGCAPEGPLRAAIDWPGEATGLLGDLCVEIRDDPRPTRRWELADVVVITHHPCQADPALVDVVVGAGVRQDGFSRERLPTSPRFELSVATAGDLETVGHCLRVDGLFAPRAAPEAIPLELVGCEPAERLRAVLRRPRKWEGGWAGLWALDRDGRVMAHHTVGLGIGGARPSTLGGTLIDITLTDGGKDRPPLIARPIWDVWYRGIPATPNQWAPYSAEGRRQWSHLAIHRDMGARRPDRSGGVYHLDGRFATDVPGLHCAMGEALLGPGGYYGWGWSAFTDCLCGGFGVVAPFTLIWHDADVARRAPAEGLPSYFGEVVGHLEEHGVTVVFR
ncbi:barstar family protein [Streptosporangium sp. NPDC020145]|uniref:barstar family protein n=1 Tax=Streptosporangium sp. NPDC020145 TaxID=3154694 RepID=UPI00341A6EFA